MICQAKIDTFELKKTVQHFEENCAGPTYMVRLLSSPARSQAIAQAGSLPLTCQIVL